MNRRQELLLVFLLVVAGGLFFLDSYGTQRSRTASAGTLSSPEQPSAGPTAPRLALEVIGMATQPDAREDGASIDEGRGVVIQDPSFAPFDNWPRVGTSYQVVTPEGGPAGGARIRLLSRASAWVGNLLESEMVDATDWGSYEGTLLGIYEADSDGRVRVPSPISECLVVFELGELRGYRIQNGAFRASARVELTRPGSIRIRVQNQSGFPVPGRKLRFSGALADRYFWDVKTDGQGEFQLHNTLALLAPIALAATAKGLTLADLLEASVLTIGSPAVAVAMDPLASSVAPIVLIVPDTGVVEVTLVRPSGELATVRSQTVEVVIELDGKKSQASLHVFDSAPGLLAGVPVGADVTVSLPGTPPLKQNRVRGRMMLAIDEGSPVLRLNLEVPEPPRSYANGRLVTLSGKPLADSRFDLAVETDPQNSYVILKKRNPSFVTNEEGAFEIEIPFGVTRSGDFNRPAGIRFVQVMNGAQPYYSKALELGPRPDLHWPLGDILCEEMPVLAAGVVVDWNGTPIEGAEVEAFEIAHDAFVVAHNERKLRRIIHTNPEWSTRSDLEGNFRIWGELRQGADSKLAVGASARKFAASPMLLAYPGDREIELALCFPGSLTGQVLLPEGNQYDEWSVRLHREGTSFNGVLSSGLANGDQLLYYARRHARLSAASGHFEFTELAPGTYTIQIEASWLAAPVSVIAGVVINDENPSSDSRLHPIDLRESLTSVIVSAVDGQGVPIAGAVWATGSREGDEGCLDELPLRGGSSTIQLAGLPTQIWVGASGFLTKMVSVQEGDLEVTLVRAPQVTLALPDGIVLEQGVTLYVDSFWPVNPDTSFIRHDWGRKEFIEGQLTISPSDLIPTALTFVIRRKSSRSTSSRFTLPAQQGEIDLRDAADRSRILIPMKQQSLDVAIRGTGY